MLFHWCCNGNSANISESRCQDWWNAYMKNASTSSHQNIIKKKVEVSRSKVKITNVIIFLLQVVLLKNYKYRGKITDKYSDRVTGNMRITMISWIALSIHCAKKHTLHNLYPRKDRGCMLAKSLWMQIDKANTGPPRRYLQKKNGCWLKWWLFGTVLQ